MEERNFIEIQNFIETPLIIRELYLSRVDIDRYFRALLFFLTNILNEDKILQ